MPERTASAPDAGDRTRTSDAELAALRAELQRAREEKDAAHREAETARRERDDAGRRLTSEVDQRYTAEEKSIEESLASSKSEIERLEEQVAELNEKGDFKAAAKATTAMTAAQARIISLEQRKTAIDGEKGRAKAAAAAAAERAPKDPLTGLSEPAKAWIRRHPQWMTDKAYQDRVTSAHYAAKAKGIAVDSDRYFRFIETAIGERRDDVDRDADRGGDRDRQDRNRGGDVDADSPLSGAADVDDAENGEIVIEGEPDVPIDGGDDLYQDAEDTVRRARERAREREVERPRAGDRDAGRRGSRTSAAAPPSRGGSPQAGTRPRQSGDGRTRLTAIEAEIALSSYPPGEHPGIKTKEDAYRAYHAQKTQLDSEGRLGVRRT
jgi:hypothetical protein